jgi:hypothetical protein
MQHIGKVAEYLVLAELIQRDVEAYSAISFRQPSYDITVIRPNLSVARVQVKGTELQNKSTNNPISNLEKEFDYLIIVVFDGETPHYYILTKSEATQAYGKKLGTIYTSGEARDLSAQGQVGEDHWRACCALTALSTWTLIYVEKTNEHYSFQSRKEPHRIHRQGTPLPCRRQI